MDVETIKHTLWSQFGASIDMLQGAIDVCSDSLWSGTDRNPRYWYIVYHALFWLDAYLSPSLESFRPPKPFTLDELDPRGVMPERAYTKEELGGYVLHCKAKCSSVVESLTESASQQRCGFPRHNMTVLELLLYAHRHVQHHVGQLALMLRQEQGVGLAWVSTSTPAPA